MDQHSDRTVLGPAAGAAPGGHGDLSERLVATPAWSDAMLAEHGIPVIDVPFVTVGGGLGSLALVDVLRIAGVSPDRIRILTDLERPYDTYRYLARNSQIPDHERIRSDAASVMDNIWGFPSYALREAWEAKSPAQLWRVLTEPVLSEWYTPQAGQVYRSVDREIQRIDWASMVSRGYVRTVRKRDAGGYFVLQSPSDPSATTARVAYRAWYVHLAVGYSAVRVLDDLQSYRETYDDYQRVVNAYEPHEHVYDEALRRPTTVVVRGSGIVASRILQRLLDDREKRGAQTRVVHVFRNYVSEPQGTRATFRRPGSFGFAFQGFNFTKSAWGGQHRDLLRRLEGEERARFIDAIGGTNTPYRRVWMDQLHRGLAAGYYTQVVGTVDDVVPTADGRGLLSRLSQADGARYEIPSEFIIDATGLEADVTEHRVLSDLLQYGGAGRNPKGRLDVERTFEVRGLRSGVGRVYASGTTTLGGYFAANDSFLGLQYAAMEIADDLAALGFGRRIGPARSIAEWWRWVLNRPPAVRDVRVPAPPLAASSAVTVTPVVVVPPPPAPVPPAPVAAPTAAPGWYPQPDGRRRYWDGSAWGMFDDEYRPGGSP